MKTIIKAKIFPLILIILVIGIFGLLGANLNNVMDMEHGNCLVVLLSGNDCPVANFLVLTNYHLSFLRNLTQTTVSKTFNFLALALLVIFIFLKPATRQLVFYRSENVCNNWSKLKSIFYQFGRFIYWLAFHNKGSIHLLFKDA